MEAWMHPKEKELILKYLSPNKTMLEWGSGGSTIEFSQLTKNYYSVEHNKEWYDNVSGEIISRGLDNVNYNFVPCNIPQNIDGRQTEYHNYKDYIDIVDKFNVKFDIVLIDGRARRLCAKKIIPYLNPNAIVIIHDWCSRNVYHCVTEHYDIKEYISDTPQTIASFTLKKDINPFAYDLNLNGWDKDPNIGTGNDFFNKNNKMEISFIQPSRNNLKYLKWSYNSIRKNQGTHDVEICVADDASDDGTWEWCNEMMKNDPNFKAIRNDGPNRLGHTILYDKLINEVATKDIAIIYHADMYLCPGALDSISNLIEKGTIVSLTRIEPPLHPDGPEKILLDCGVEPEEFDEDKLFIGLKDSFIERKSKTTEGIFAPWAFYRKDFQKIGGHDPLYAPQSKEDSDIFNRFQLNGVKFLQTWEGCVYHMTCRGSRRNTADKATSIYQDSPEWLEQNKRSTKNFIRKWGHFVKHDELMKPIIPPKYDIGIQLVNSNEQLLAALEPWCTSMYTDIDFEPYCTKEQPNTLYPLLSKMYGIEEDVTNDVLIRIDCKLINKFDIENIYEISSILKDSGEVGEFELGNLKIRITQLKEYQDELIHL